MIFLMSNRCRIEQRMKRLAELQTKKTLSNNHISTPEPNVTRSTTPEPTMSLKGRVNFLNKDGKKLSYLV